MQKQKLGRSIVSLTVILMLVGLTVTACVVSQPAAPAEPPKEEAEPAEAPVEEAQPADSSNCLTFLRQSIPA